MCVVIASSVNDMFRRREFVLDLIDLSPFGHNSLPVAYEIARRLDVHTHPRQILFGSTTDTAANMMKLSSQIVTNLEALTAGPVANGNVVGELPVGLREDDANGDYDGDDDVGKPKKVKVKRRGRGVAANEADRAIKCICHGMLAVDAVVVLLFLFARLTRTL